LAIPNCDTIFSDKFLALLVIFAYFYATFSGSHCDGVWRSAEGGLHELQLQPRLGVPMPQRQPTQWRLRTFASLRHSQVTWRIPECVWWRHATCRPEHVSSTVRPPTSQPRRFVNPVDQSEQSVDFYFHAQGYSHRWKICL